MQSKIISFLVGVFASVSAFSQNTVSVEVSDSTQKALLVGVTVTLKNDNIGAFTDLEGKAELTNIPDGEQTIIVSYLGYKMQQFTYTFPTETPLRIKVYLEESPWEMDETVVEITRTNRSIKDIPTRTEVLTEEIDEAASMEPSKIGHLITHSTGIQVQTTSATSNGAVARIQGLNGRYTMMLKDGFPMYGGFSGSLDVLMIPPLDLRQVEYIKGPASTLYGGGAIGGLINLLTKKPSDDQTLLHLNGSNIGAKDFNTFIARKLGKVGFTNLATMHLHSPYDPDGDGFTDIPEVRKFNFNPKFFYKPNFDSEIYLGVNVTNDSRKGGDLDLVNGQTSDATNFYLDKQESNRYITQLQIQRNTSGAGTIYFRNSVNIYDRNISLSPDNTGASYNFGGRTLNTWSEISYSEAVDESSLSLGVNLKTEEFEQTTIDTAVDARDMESLNFGAFINYLRDFGDKLSLEGGLRVDGVSATSLISNAGSNIFTLPKLNILYRLNDQFSIRTGGGMGYRMPTIFNEESEPLGYRDIKPIDYENVNPEKSLGANFDLKFETDFGSDKMLLSVNEMVFYNQIDNPVLLTQDSLNLYEYQNVGERIESKGLESQIKFTVGKFTWFLGYTYTDANLVQSTSTTALTLVPKHSIKGDILFVDPGKWRIGLDYDFKSSQFLSNGNETRSLFMTGVIVERTLDDFVLFVNFENWTDTRQSRYESLLSGPNSTTQLTEIWAPLDGFYLNIGIKVSL